MQRLARIGSVLVLGVAMLGACGGDDESDSPSDATERTDDSSDNSTDDTVDDTPTTVGSDLPAFSTEWDRVCTTQVGYAGAAEYTEGPGPHMIVYLEDYRDEGTYVTSSRTLPDGWALVEDSDYEDNSEFAAVELVGCLDRTEVTPTGTDCDFEDDGETLTLSLSDATYELTVYTATTGEVVGTATLEAIDPECPFIATFETGDTEFVNTLDDDQVINALKEFVAPA
jgi:hypothetical protein